MGYSMGNLDPDLLKALLTVVDNYWDIGRGFSRLLLWRQLCKVGWGYQWVFPLYWDILGRNS